MDHNNKQVDMEKTMTAEEFLMDFTIEYKGIDFVEDAMEAYANHKARHLIEGLSDDEINKKFKLKDEKNTTDYLFNAVQMQNRYILKGARTELLNRLKRRVGYAGDTKSRC